MEIELTGTVQFTTKTWHPKNATKSKQQNTIFTDSAKKRKTMIYINLLNNS